jgi:hypothetical protein
VPEIRYPAIPEPTTDVNALLNTVRQLKEAVELMTGQRGEEHSFATQTKTLQRQFGSSTAKFTQELKVQGGNTTALAAQITSVEAVANGISANGEIKFEAKSTPGGATASYGLFLTAGDKFAGFEVIATSGGDAAINFTADQFRLGDTGTSDQVFEYDSGDGVFVPVEMVTEDIAAAAVTNIASGLADVGSGVQLDVPMTTIAGTPVFIIVSVYDPAFNSISAPNVVFGGVFRSFPIACDGSLLENLQSFDPLYNRNGSGQFQTFMHPSSIGVKIGAGILSAGVHHFTVTNTAAFNLRFSLVVMELKR